MFNVLSLDGGGIRGVIPAVVLDHIEQTKGKAISDQFDLIVGTSTGGILAAGLAVKGPGGKPKFTAAEMVDLYAKKGKKIFDRSFWRGVTSLGGTLDEQYSHKPLESILQNYLGNATLKDCLTPVVITSYDIERREPYFFKSSKAGNKGRNHYLRDAARATSAAPTFFEPAKIKSIGSPATTRALIDGGVFVNNPAMCAYTEARSTFKQKREDIRVVSIGTGVATRKIPYKDAKDWGLAGWVRPIISVMMDGAADAADFHLRELLPDVDAGSDQRYFRFDTELDLALDDMDAANAGNIENLKAEARQIIKKQAKELARI